MTSSGVTFLIASDFNSAFNLMQADELHAPPLPPRLPPPQLFFPVQKVNKLIDASCQVVIVAGIISCVAGLILSFTFTEITVGSAILIGIAITGAAVQFIAGTIILVVQAVALAILFREVWQEIKLKRSFFAAGTTPGEAILKELNAFPECAALIQEANDVIARCNLPPLEIHIMPTKSGFNAEQEDNIIRIKPGQSAGKILSYAIFELANLSQNEKFLKIHQENFRGTYTSAEEYTRDMEFVEFHSAIRRNQISPVVNSYRPRYFRPFMNNAWERHALPAIGFDQYYNTFLNDVHKNYYRNAWTKHQAALTAYKEALIEHQAKQAESDAKYFAERAKHKVIDDYLAEIEKNLPNIAETKAQLAAYRAKHFPKPQM